ncbi:tRNA-dihydrouridine synthase [Streptococcus suis]|nr:tRNA-dihydrouridine synthase [Streptococcus suis]
MANLNTPFMIGDVEIPNRCVLAPMAGVTNSAFRTIAKEMGAGLVVMEMISEKGLLYNNEKTLHMLHIDDNEYPMSIQLFGGDAEGLKRAADFIQKNTKANIVDINMGCPVNKVIKNEAGAKWLKDPDKIYHIIKEVTSVLDIPLTVKMRTGWNNTDLAVENALAAESGGVAALAMHGRTREQMYTGTVDLETLTKVAGSLTKIPFIANGDIRNVEDARQRIEEVGADAVMVGRTAMGNPYIFNQINHYLETGEVLPDLSFDDKLNVAFDHLTRLTNLKGESIAVREFRGLAPHYLRGSAGAAKIRGAVARAETIEQVQELFDQVCRSVDVKGLLQEIEKGWIPLHPSLNPLDRGHDNLVMVKGKILCRQDLTLIRTLRSLEIHIDNNRLPSIWTWFDQIQGLTRQVNQVGNSHHPAPRIPLRIGNR